MQANLHINGNINEHLYACFKVRDCLIIEFLFLKCKLLSMLSISCHFTGQGEGVKKAY